MYAVHIFVTATQTHNFNSYYWQFPGKRSLYDHCPIVVQKHFCCIIEPVSVLSLDYDFHINYNLRGKMLWNAAMQL